MNVSAFIPIKKFSTSKKRLSNIISFAEREALAASMAKNTIDILSKSKICNSITVVTNDCNLHLENSKSYFTELSLNESLDKILVRENRMKLYKDTIKFIDTRIELDLASFTDDIWAH